MTETFNFIDRGSAEEVNPGKDDQCRIVLEAMRVGIIFSDESGHFWVFNSEMEKLTGYSMDEANACSDFTLLLHPDLKDCDQVLDGFDNLVKPGDIYETKTIICTKNGTYRTVFVSTTLILYKGHRMFLSTYYDVTGSEQVEEALLESEEKYRSMINDVLDASQTGIFVLDSEFKVAWINHSIEKYFGFKKENIIGKDKRQLIESSIKDIFEDPDTFREEVFATYDNNTYVENFECHVLLDGKRRERWLEHRSQPIKLGLYKGGRVEYYTDITERKQAEKSLKKNFQQQKLLTEVSYLFTKLGKFDENMNDVLRIIGKHTNVSRVYVFEDFNNGEYTKNTFEWCNKNIEPQIDNLLETPYSIVPSWKKILNEKGMVFSTNISELPQDIKVILEPQKIKSILVLPIYIKDQFFGFMGFDECETHKVWDKSEIDLLKTLANVVSTIFERRQAEKLIRVSKEKFRDLANLLPQIVYEMDINGNLTFVNKQAFGSFGYSQEDYEKGINVMQTLIPEDIDRAKENIQNILNGKKVVNPEYTAMRKDGSTFPILMYSSCVLKDNKHVGLRGIIVDITEQKQIEEELARIAAEQKNIMATISDGVYMLDLSGNLVNWNKEVDEVTGLSAEELKDKPIVEFFAEEDRAAVAEATRKGLEEGTGEVTGHFLRKDRTPAIYQWSVAPLKDPQGKVIGLTGVGRDITEQKQIEEELARIAAEQKNIMATISDGVYMLDLSGNLVNWNKEVDEVTGLSAEELKDKPIVEFFAEEDRAAVAEATRKGLEEGTGEVSSSETFCDDM